MEDQSEQTNMVQMEPTKQVVQQQPKMDPTVQQPEAETTHQLDQVVTTSASVNDSVTTIWNHLWMNLQIPIMSHKLRSHC